MQYNESSLLGFGLASGIAIAVIATLQVTVALLIGSSYDPGAWRAFTIEPLYPLLFWLLSALAALRAETLGLARGPRSARVVWDIPREPLGH